MSQASTSDSGVRERYYSGSIIEDETDIEIESINNIQDTDTDSTAGAEAPSEKGGRRKGSKIYQFFKYNEAKDRFFCQYCR